MVIKMSRNIKWEKKQLTNDLSCLEWSGGSRHIRKFEDGSIVWFLHNNEIYVNLIINFHSNSCTGPHWTIRTAYSPDPQDRFLRVEIWVEGETRKEAFKNFRKKVGAYRELLSKLTMRS